MRHLANGFTVMEMVILIALFSIALGVALSLYGVAVGFDDYVRSVSAAWRGEG